jgi:hypothetical protein
MSVQFACHLLPCLCNYACHLLPCLYNCVSHLLPCLVSCACHLPPCLYSCAYHLLHVCTIVPASVAMSVQLRLPSAAATQGCHHACHLPLPYKAATMPAICRCHTRLSLCLPSATAIQDCCLACHLPLPF